MAIIDYPVNVSFPFNWLRNALKMTKIIETKPG